jgi:hypothetical protein
MAFGEFRHIEVIEIRAKVVNDLVIVSYFVNSLLDLALVEELVLVEEEWPGIGCC